MSKAGSKASKNKKSKVSRISYPPSPIVLTYTYMGEEEEVNHLFEVARKALKAGKFALASAIAEMAESLGLGIAMGTVAPGDTVYATI